MRKTVAVSLIGCSALVLFFSLQLQHPARAGGAVVTTIDGDVNGDGALNLGDPIHLLVFMFAGGSPPAVHADTPQILDRVGALENQAATLASKAEVAALEATTLALREEINALKNDAAAVAPRLAALEDSSRDVGAKVFSSTGASIPYGTPTTLTFDQESWDTDQVHEPETNPGRLTVKTPGKYFVFASVLWGAFPNGIRRLSLLRNGSEIIANDFRENTYGNGGQGGLTQSVATCCDLQAGDFVEVVVEHTAVNGTALLTLSINNWPGHSPDFGMIRIPAGP